MKVREMGRNVQERLAQCTPGQKKGLGLLLVLSILLIIGFGWDESQRHVALDAGSVNSGGAAEEQKDGTEAGEAICSVQGALRYRPLPDLFAPALPDKAAAQVTPVATVKTQAAVKAASPQIAAVKQTADTKKEETREIPLVCGAVHQGRQHLAILQAGKTVQSYAAGEICSGWRVVYVNESAVGLEREGQILELAL